MGRVFTKINGEIGMTDRESKYPQLNDVEWLKERYIEKELSISAMAEEMGSFDRLYFRTNPPAL